MCVQSDKKLYTSGTCRIYYDPKSLTADFFALAISVRRQKYFTLYHTNNVFLCLDFKCGCAFVFKSF